MKSASASQVVTRDPRGPVLRKSSGGGRKRRKKAARKMLSRLHRPADMSLEEWQTELRRQFGREQHFRYENVGTLPVFSEFRVSNPDRGTAYRVSIRGPGLGDNLCTCPDFATNTLGTCKHIEFVLGKLSRKPGGASSLRAGFKPPYSEIFLKYGSCREVRFRAGAECPSPLLAEVKNYFDGQGRMRLEAFGKMERLLAAAERQGHELRCHEDVLNFIAEVRDAERRCQLIDAAFPMGIRSESFSKLLKANLYDYQRAGALFAARAGRCLIGDEMGLGKTIQAIAAAEILARHVGIARVLVICPTSLKHQWEREIGQFCTRSAQVIQGLRSSREEAFSADSFFKITNYDTVHRDLDLIAGWAPDLVILDEAQRIKNWNTRAARSVKSIVSPHAIVLTGTPLENRLEELVSLVEFVDRHRLGPTFRFLANHQILDEFGKVVGYRDLDSIGKTLQPILIRRRKEQVLTQLPPRLDKTFFVPMTPEQMRHHEENRETVARIVSKWRRYRFLSEADQRRLMIALQNMRMSCVSTYLLDQATDFGAKPDELAVLVDEICERPDAKVVVFSQWQRTQELLARRLTLRGWGHIVFNGNVPGPERKKLIDRFREDAACRVFLSTDAGGVGLNLQHASVVVNMDLPWNPAVLEQRIGRVHRLGQKRPVQVVNFVSQGTIEEGMLSLLTFKKSLFTGALDGGTGEVFLGGSRLTRFMETVEKAASSIPVPPPAEPPAMVEAEVGTGPSEDLPGRARNNTAHGERQASETAKGPPSDAPVPGGGNPWSALLETGIAILSEVARSAGGGGSGGNGTHNVRVGSLVRKDPGTGESYLHLPVPNAETVNQLVSAMLAWLGARGD